MDYDTELKRFLRKRRLRGLSEKTLEDDESQIKHFLRFVGDKELTSDLILDFLDYITTFTYDKKGKQCKYSKATLYQMESKVRLFLKFIDPELCKDIQPHMPRNRKLPEDILNEEDIEKLLNACTNLRDKALIAFLFESGARKGELLALKKNSVVFDSLGAVITIPSGKTGSRRIRVVFSASYLRQYIENHPNTDKDSFLFCSNRYPFGSFSNSGLKWQLKDIAKRAGITKNVFPHLLRHSAATRLAKHLSEQSLKTYLGWTQGSSMASIYVHLSGQDVDPDILRMNGIEVENIPVPSLQVGRCPRCKELNPETSLYCGKCGLPLKDEIKNKIEKDMQDIDMVIMKTIASDPKVLEALAEELNKIQGNKTK